MKRALSAAFFVVCCMFGPLPALSVEPSEMLDDPVLEARAREISQDLRCPVCQNQSIDDSDADLAQDLRLLVRERLKAGDTDEEVVAYIRARYGDFVLLEPPVQPTTYLLWFGPALLAALGLLAVILFFRRRQRQMEEAPLTESERRRLDTLLEAGPTDDHR